MYRDNVRNIHAHVCHSIHKNSAKSFCVVFFFYFIKISKFTLPGVLLMYERTSIDRKKESIIHEHATCMYFKNHIWAELSYEFGRSCLINLGRVVMGRVLCGPSWHGPSWFGAELSVILLDYVPHGQIKKVVFSDAC